MEIREKVLEVLNSVLPSDSHIIVDQYQSCLGRSETLKIVLAVSDYEINRVRGQYIQDVSLRLDIAEMLLEVQVFGGNGGQSIYLVPDKNHPREKYLAMASYKIPFRKPKQEEKFVMKAIKVFAERWLQALKDNKERLFYQDKVDYDAYFAS